MSLEAYRWLMTAVHAPLERAAFRAEPGTGEVVVGIAGCGVCHTDLGYHFDAVRTNRPLPLAPGHEISGRVVAAAGTGVKPGSVAIVGFTMDKVEVRLSNLMAFDARAIGNWGCPPESYPEALDLVLDGKVEIKPFVEAHPLDDINRVFAAVHHREIKKRAVLVPAHA